MKEFGPFRLIDGIVRYRKEEGIVTRCKLPARRTLIAEYGLPAMLLEYAAQSCALMSRIEDLDATDCFLGKVKRIDFHNAPSVQTSVLANVARITHGSELSRYTGEVETSGGLPVAHFDLLVCTVRALGGNTDIRSKYWKNYLDGLLGKCTDVA
ncbi:MAG: hypothetical protein ABFD98_13180 [Syntrophobacteraceae bacterium]|nr:hypothetical protein [Desulfobacteraceae bacterium]